MEVKGGENVRFKHKKPVFVLKLYIYIYIYMLV
jgi:hypothetical protein